jgi:hypothetical protein
MADDPVITSDVVVEDSGISISSPIPAVGAEVGGEKAKTEVSTFNDVLPAELKEKPFMKNIKDFPGLFKAFAGAQELLGRRPAGIPTDTAPKEEWDKFIQAARPEKIEDYDLPKEDAEKNPEWDKAVRGLFHNSGITKWQAKALYDGFNTMAAGQIKAQAEKQVAMDKEFDALITQTFGAEQDKAIANSKALLKEVAPQFTAKLDSLDNNSLLILTAALHGITKKYVREDSLVSGSGSGLAETKQDLLDKGIELIKSPAYSSAFHPDHEKVQKEARELYKKISLLPG